MTNNKEIEKAKKFLEMLKSQRGHVDEKTLKDEELGLVGVEGIADQKAKHLGVHPRSAKKNKERGFLSISSLVIILVLFQIAFVATLVLLFKN